MILGVDIGYGFTKAVAPDGREATFPSVVGKAEKIRYQNDLVGGSEGIRVDGYFVGELAMLQSRLCWTLLDRSRTETPIVLTLFRAALSQVADGGHVKVVTGLPVEWYADKDALAAKLRGGHSVGGRRFYVADVLVVPQPFGSLFYLILDEDGRLADEELARGRLGIIDVGTYTTDYVLVDRLRYVEKGSGSIPVAMARAHELIGRELLDRYGLDLPLHEVDRAVREGHVAVFGERKPIGELARPVLETLAEEVLAKAATLWGDGRELDKVLVTGGGALHIGHLVKARYPHALVVWDAPMANARGFLRYGRRRWG